MLGRTKGCLIRFLRLGCYLMGTLFAIQLLFGFIGAPGFIKSWIEGRMWRLEEDPRIIVVLGGGGIPSESGLIRTYYGAWLGQMISNMTYIVALPAGDSPEEQSVELMKQELVMRGVAPEDILLEDQGLNTYQQAYHIRILLGDEMLDEPILIVTSPTHMRRALMCFREQGFSRLGGGIAVSLGHEADPGFGVQWRYVFWANLEYQVRTARELVAIAYYKIKGWI